MDNNNDQNKQRIGKWALERGELESKLKVQALMHKNAMLRMQRMNGETSKEAWDRVSSEKGGRLDPGWMSEKVMRNRQLVERLSEEMPKAEQNLRLSLTMRADKRKEAGVPLTKCRNRVRNIMQDLQDAEEELEVWERLLAMYWESKREAKSMMQSVDTTRKTKFVDRVMNGMGLEMAKAYELGYGEFVLVMSPFTYRKQSSLSKKSIEAAHNDIKNMKKMLQAEEDDERRVTLRLKIESRVEQLREMKRVASMKEDASGEAQRAFYDEDEFFAQLYAMSRHIEFHRHNECQYMPMLREIRYANGCLFLLINLTEDTRYEGANEHRDMSYAMNTLRVPGICYGLNMATSMTKVMADADVMPAGLVVYRKGDRWFRTEIPEMCLDKCWQFKRCGWSYMHRRTRSGEWARTFNANLNGNDNLNIDDDSDEDVDQTPVYKLKKSNRGRKRKCE